MPEPVLATDISGLPRFGTGKVRDVYDLGDTLLIVTSDRISAFDSVMPNGIPDKGRVLTQLSRHWFRVLRPVVANHYITTDADFIVDRLTEHGVRSTPDLRAILDGRAMLTVKAEVFPVECVVRGYISGSLWKEYADADGPQGGATLHGIALPAGLRESDRLPEPLFTPATKAASGHDINIGFAELAEIVGGETAAELHTVATSLYEMAAERALKSGIVIADTKFEFGAHKGVLTLVDEALTPDSSRFWNAAAYSPGRSQPSYDKQYLRDWLIASGWDREPPAPALPPDVVAKTAEKYREAYRLITGQEL